MKTCDFWDVTQCILVMAANVLKEYAYSILLYNMVIIRIHSVTSHVCNINIYHCSEFRVLYN